MDQRRKIVNELLYSGISIATTLATYYLVKKLMQPDFTNTMRMRVALTVKHVAQQQADSWQTVADHAGTMYNRVRT